MSGFLFAVPLGNVTVHDSLKLQSTLPTQLPSGLDVILPINFHPTSEVSAKGCIAYNAVTNKFTIDKGVYRVGVLVSYGRTGGVGESFLFFVSRAGPAGFEQEGDNAIFAKLDNDKTGIPASISTLVDIPADGTEMDFVLWRDSAGNDSGGLYQTLANRAGAPDSATAGITVQKIG